MLIDEDELRQRIREIVDDNDAYKLFIGEDYDRGELEEMRAEIKFLQHISSQLLGALIKGSLMDIDEAVSLVRRAEHGR